MSVDPRQFSTMFSIDVTADAAAQQAAAELDGTSR